MVLAPLVLHKRAETRPAFPWAALFATLLPLLWRPLRRDPSFQESCMSTPQVREQFLVISALGPNPMELTSVLCRASQENRCGVVSSRLTRHGEYSSLTLQISGSWDALARLEGALPALAKRHGFSVNMIRSGALEARPNSLP
jgi:hypothetical protein